MIQKLQALAAVLCIGLPRVQAAAVNAGSGTLEVEIGAKLLSVQKPQKAEAQKPQKAFVAVTRREEVKDEEVQMSLREGAASQDGAFPFFVGSWNGKRNNWYGDVGVSFVPQKDFTIVSLGRHHHNETGLIQTAPVTLWSVETKMPLAIVNIGPHSFLEGHYHWEPVDAPGVTVSQGREYRLTQACTPNMADKWFDRVVSFEEVESNAATGFARFVGGVNMSGFGYPENTNGQFRRPGMVNFKMRPPPVHIIENSAHRSNEVASAIAVMSLLSAIISAGMFS